jgi:hypothetical protein
MKFYLRKILYDILLKRRKMTDIYYKVKEKSTSAKIYKAKIKTDTDFYAKKMSCCIYEKTV